MSDDLAALWEKSKPAEDLSALWDKSALPTAEKSSTLGDVADVVSRELVAPVRAGLTGIAHGISSGTGPISRAVRASLYLPGEKEELDAAYAAEPDAMKKVGDFVGSAYTPENAVIGQAVGTGLGAVGKLAAGPIGRWLEAKGLAQGKRVLTGGANPLAVKKPLTDEATRAAFDVGAITPGGTVQHAADVLKGARGAAAGEVGSILDRLTAAGVEGPDGLALARALRTKAADLERSSVATGAPEFYRKIADEIESKLSAAPAPGTVGPPAPTLGLKPAEGIKRSLQEKAVYDKVQGDKIIEGARKDIASTVRQSVEDAVAAQAAKAPEDAARFVPAKTELGNLIEASTIANKGAAQSARRNAFSLRDVLLGSGAASAGAAAAGPMGALAGPATAIGSHLARTRGTPTVAWGAYRAGQALIDAGAAPAAGGVSKVGPILTSLASGASETGPDPTAAARSPLSGGGARATVEEHQRNDPSRAAEPRSPVIDEVRRILATNPQVFGNYGPVMTRALAKSPETFAAYHYATWKSDPSYRAALSGQPQR